MVKEIEMCETRGKNVRVICTNGKKFVGRCAIFTQALDNEPEIASIMLEIPNISSYIEIMQNEIKSIDILD